MSEADFATPSASALRAPLRRITEALAAELSQPTEQPPAWSALDWRLARAVASMHGVSALLAAQLRWSDPIDFRQFLEDQRRQTTARFAAIERLLEAIDRRGRGAGIAVQPLKGAALHARGLYQAGERPMADVDLLVRPADLEGATQLLADLGYDVRAVSWKHRVLEPRHAATVARPREHADNPIKIDLHSRVVERLPRRYTDITALVAPASPCPGVNAYASQAALLLHLVLHAAGSIVNNALRLVQLNDIARLAQRLTAYEWDEVAAAGVNSYGLAWALPPLYLAERYFPGTVPASCIAALERRCSRWLRHVTRSKVLAELSYSHPFVRVAPGIAWSQSPLDLLGYLWQRGFDGRREEFQYAASSELWASETDWYARSQLRRILAWLRGRPERTQTIHSIRAALRQAS